MSWKDLLAASAIVLFISLLTSILTGRIRAGMLAGVFGTLLFLVVGFLQAVSDFVDHAPSRHETLLLRPSLSPPLPASLRPHSLPSQTRRRATTLAEAAPAVALEKPDAPPIALNSREPSPGPPRPAWMDAETGRVDNLYRTRIAVGPWLSRIECEQELPEALRRAVQTYADRLLGEGKGQSVNLPMSYIHEHIVRGEWEERRQQTIDTMIYLHELLEFDRQANRMIEASYQQSVVVGRLGYIAAGGGALLGLLTILFGYLKLDTLTRGYYTGRLRLTAATAILGLAALAGLLVLA